MTLLPNGKTRIAVCFAFLAACGIYGTFARGEQPAAALSPHPSVSPGVSAAPPQVMGWRNDGSGRYPLATPPREWSETKNILWKTKVGPNKYSSPILVAARLFLLSDPAWLCCVSANDGKPLWRQSNTFADLPEKTVAGHRLADAGNTTATPVSDGQFVYVVFGTGIVACYDLTGTRQWIRYFPFKPTTEYGRATSPVLAGGKLLVTLSHLLAIDPKTGRDVWTNKNVPESYGTPVVANLLGVEVLVMPSGQIVRVSDGVILAGDLGGLKFASPIVQEDTVYLLQAGSSACRFSTATAAKWIPKPVWEQELEGTFYASAVWDRGLIHAVANEYKFSILDAGDGKILATHDLVFPNLTGRPDADAANLYPSLALAGDYLYVFNDQGDALVLKPGRQYQELRRNHLGDGHGGTPIFAGRHLYLRSGQFLYCVGEK